MDWLVNLMYYVVPFVVLLGILVFVHELGHYLVAKFSGVQVEAFSIGFGKELWGVVDKSGTRWKISAIPLGGYCQFLGDGDETSTTSEAKELTDEQKKKAFAYQSPFKKLLISLAGPAANYVFAVLIFASIFYFIGKIEFPPIVGEVVKGGAAEQAGILPKDRILSVNGKKVSSFTDVRREVELNTEEKVQVELERGGKIIRLAFPLQYIEIENDAVLDKTGTRRPMLGIRSVNVVEVQKLDLNVFQALRDAGIEVWNITDMTLRGVGQMIVGERGSEEIGGVIRIAEMSGDITRQQGILNLLVFMALLSVNLGLINLFPIPLLDGGHVVIYLIEIATRREINEKVKDGLFKVGFALLISLMVFATWNDVVRLFNRWFA